MPLGRSTVTRSKNAYQRATLTEAEAAAVQPQMARGIAQAPNNSVVPAPIVGVVVRSSDRDPIRARDWALFSMIVLYPVWRMLGATLFIVPLLAIPMALELLRRRRVRYPGGYAVWMSVPRHRPARPGHAEQAGAGRAAAALPASAATWPTSSAWPTTSPR